MTDKPRSSAAAVPATHARLRGWKRFLPFAKIKTRNGLRIRPLWRELVILATVASAALWLSGAFVVWSVAKYRRGIADARFANVVLPFRWDHFRRTLGNHAIALATRQLADGRINEAEFHLRHGLAKSPANLHGRLLLAEIYVRSARSTAAQEVLLGGLTHASRAPDYLRATFAYLLQRQEDDLVQSCADTLLDDPALSPVCAAVTAHAAASSAFLRGNFDHAEDLLELHRLSATPDGRLLHARIEWERGYRDLALVQIRALIADFPGSDPARAQLRAWVLAQRDLDEFRRLTLLEKIVHPRDAAARVDLLRALHTTAPQDFAREVDAFFDDFPLDETALLTLADFAAHLGDATLATRVHEHALRHQLPHFATACLLAEALIAARDYRGALQHLRELAASAEPDAHRTRFLASSLEALACFGLGDTLSGELHLRTFLAQPHPRAENLLAVADRLVELGALTHARDALAKAVDADPLNQPALARLIELELALDEHDALPALLARLLKMRRPPPALLRTAYDRLASDEFLFAPNRDVTLAALENALASPSPRAASRAGSR